MRSLLMIFFALLSALSFGQYSPEELELLAIVPHRGMSCRPSHTLLSGGRIRVRTNLRHSHLGLCFAIGLMIGPIMVGCLSDCRFSDKLDVLSWAVERTFYVHTSRSSAAHDWGLPRTHLSLKVSMS